MIDFSTNQMPLEMVAVSQQIVEQIYQKQMQAQMANQAQNQDNGMSSNVQQTAWS